MAKKRIARICTAYKIQQKLAASDYLGAYSLAKQDAELSPRDPAVLELLRSVILTAGDGYVQAGRTQALALFLQEIDAGQFQDEPWQRQLATLYAKAGQLNRALELADKLGDAALRSLMVGHLCDHAVRSRSTNSLPPEWQPGYQTVIAAFQKYHLGHENAAKDRLNEISLSSPFLEWKVLLRGFLAYSANDDDTARANWGRLHPERLPAKLAAPYRSQIDPTAPKSSTAAPSDPNSLASRLRTIQVHIGRGRNLDSAFKALDSVLPFVKTKLPSAVPRLANVFYHALSKFGQPEDMARLRRYFGAPADDPEFHKLQGQRWEESGELRVSLEHWAIYDGWLSQSPAGWPEPLARRARALVQHRMAGLAAELAEQGEGSPFEEFFEFRSGGSRKAPKSKEKGPDPVIYLRKAVELAPDWEPPALELFESLLAQEKINEAEKVARAFLSRVPGCVPMLNRLAMGLSRLGRAAESLELHRQALAANPLDRINQIKFATAVIAAARRLAIDGKLLEAEQLLTAEAEACQKEVTGQFHALRAALAQKAGRKDEAETTLETALKLPGARLAVRLCYQANLVLLKGKPADKTAASKALTAALAEVPTPIEAGQLYAVWVLFFSEGLTYTGQKTQEKKIFDTIQATAKAEVPEPEFEHLCRVLLSQERWKVLAKLAESLMKRFKANPLFLLMFVEAELGKNDGRVRPFKLAQHLTTAKRLAAASPHERHKQLLPRIDDLIPQVSPFESILDRFF